ncbi:tRNA (guanine-N(7)-)-methyltransferase (tRNA(m7G46)-methyltransferase) [Neofusicoccum ribis]|uniref:tRNA (Guanine-N(7)-)-methyltransferase (tRNA(m7G46)-methyltransferase) n=1 Tax=Neofusicoccum ribis TaxID=45134 RepID=A0ABR3SV65_9PEZI
MELTRRDVILACIAAFIAWGHLTHWAPSLRYVPQAFLAGVAITVAGIVYLIASTSRSPELALARPLRAPQHAAFVSPQAWKAETASLKSRALYRREPLYPPSFVISDHLDNLLDLILRDFVQTWYGAISPRPTFTNEVDRAIRAALGNIRDRLLAADLVEIAISRAVPMVTTHMRDFYEAERIVRGRKLSRDVTESDELDNAIAAKYRDGKLHPAASLTYTNPKSVQQQHLRGIVARLMPQVLPRTMRTSQAVNTLIKEIVACAVLFPVIQMLADPDTWNQMMEGYGRALLQDRKTVRKLRAALDEHAPVSPKLPKTAPFPRLAPGDNERNFERFIRAIRQCNSLSDARRFRSEIASQLKRESAIEGQDPLYVRRLETARKILDQRVVQLSAGSAAKQKLALQPGLARRNSRLENANLRHVLYDASGLSYFMEFMDRQGLMRLVQFWIVVDGFRDPLEEDTGETDDASLELSWGASERADLAQIYEGYLTKPELAAPDNLRRIVDDFLRAGKRATSIQYLAARRAVLQVQSLVYHEMADRYFARFKKSDLWYKWLASDETSSLSKSPTGPPIQGHTITAAPSSIKPPPLPRTLSTQSADLRRAAVSTSDLKSIKTLQSPTAPARRSLDDSGRPPLFDDDIEPDPMAGSIQSIDSDFEPYRPNGDNSQIVDAMQEALEDIMDNDADRDSLFSDGPKSIQDNESLRGSFEIARSGSPAMAIKDREKPSISSLGLVGAPTTRGVFSDNLFGDEERFLEDEMEDSDANDKDAEDEIHEAAPGDLGLAEAIDTLTQDLDRLVNQESIVDSLTKKAELTNNAAELRILKKSKASLQREIHRKELQRQQYVIQESDNSLYGRATVSIQSIMVGKDEAGSEFALYVIERAISSSDPSDSQAETKDFVSRIYSSVSDGMEEFIGNIPVLDQLSLAGQNLISAATTQLNNGNGAAGIGPAAAATSAIANDPQAAAEAEAELRAYENQQLEPFIKPICDLFLEVFELNRENNWLRGRAVVVVLHQLLGGTIERKVRENVKVLTQEDNIVKYIGTLRDSMWPPTNGGQMVRDKPPRTEGEKAKSRKEAGLMLATLIPDLAGSVVGRANAQAASRRILATLNNQRLNTHLVYSLLDEIVQIIFGV